jgi:hypothetical protein
MGVPVYNIPAGTVSKPPLLRGEVEKLGKDAKTRVERLINVLKYAHMRITEDDENTLKIFMVPEFYFRSGFEKGPYTFAQYRAIKSVLRETLADGVLFKNWLIVAGTIVWKFDQKEISKRISNNPKYKIYFNTALFIKPLIKGVKETGTIEKFKASPIDGISLDDENTMWASKHWPEKYSGERAKEKHFFNVGTLKLGLEVCMEHGGKLLRAYNRTPDTDIKPLDLQLLIAAGMPIDLGAIAIKSKGFILRNDGVSDGYKKDDDDEEEEEEGPPSDYSNALKIKTEDGDAEKVRAIVYTNYMMPMDDETMRIILPITCPDKDNAPQCIRIYNRELL